MVSAAVCLCLAVCVWRCGNYHRYVTFKMLFSWQLRTSFFVCVRVLSERPVLHTTKGDSNPYFVRIQNESAQSSGSDTTSAKPPNTRTYKTAWIPPSQVVTPPRFYVNIAKGSLPRYIIPPEKIRSMKPLAHSMYNITPPTCFEFCTRTFFTTRWYRTYKIRVRKQDPEPDYPENLTPNQFQNTKWQEFQNWSQKRQWLSCWRINKPTQFWKATIHKLEGRTICRSIPKRSTG